MKTKNIAKIQHYVPQFLLKHFSGGKKPQVWIFDKHSGKIFKSHVKNIAAESGFYDFEYDGHNFTVECSLADIETTASKIINKIIKTESIGELTAEEKVFLSHFFAIQFVRTKQYRLMYLDSACTLAKALSQKGVNPVDLGYTEPSEEEAKTFAIQSMLKSEVYAPHFLAKKWVLLKATKNHPFYMSDNPIALQNHKDFGFYGNIGLAVNGIEIYFPLSKTLSLGMWCPSLEETARDAYSKYKFIESQSSVIAAQVFNDPLYYENLMAGFDTGRSIPSKPENVINHNSLQVKYSSRFVFSSTDDFSLAKEMLAAHPELKDGPKVQVN
ncbi:MAG: DUF4238 domain-containing protein [Desulfuromonadales bacterium]|nr:DUF4238 domain-containing protein [Desulfuromonadales bacterium]